ncbi:MAG: hypothetical protein ACLQQ4_09560 [Bacteroidia bacterium]
MVQINIGGKLRPFKFGFNAIDIFCREHCIGIAEFGERFAKIANGSSTLGELRDMVYAGLYGGALSNNQPVDFNSYQVGDWMDEMGKDELARMMEDIAGSLAIKKNEVKREKVIGTKP